MEKSWRACVFSWGAGAGAGKKFEGGGRGAVEHDEVDPKIAFGFIITDFSRPSLSIYLHIGVFI